MIIAKKVFLGIDWGTHSSKWAADIIPDKGKNINRSNLIHSDLLFCDEHITISPSDDYCSDHERTNSLKRRIILDPHGAFWEYDRNDIGMPLGMGVLFSICSLLGDFLTFIKNNKMSLDESSEVEIGFSFPNWLRDKDIESKVAVNHYHQAIILACYLFQMNSYSLPVPSKPYKVSIWKDIVEKSIKKFSFPEANRIKISDMTIINYNLSEFCDAATQYRFNWKYLVESCAAGLPYLRNIKLQSPLGLRGLGKLLVIDIGAGSTDIGYMLRTLNLKGEENLFYFTPAQTLRIAGNELTEKIRGYHHEGGRNITFSEAEAFKITNTDRWIDKPFVSNWRNDISEPVKQYLEVIPDNRWLSVDVPLNVIMTGGSGFVPGLADEIKLKVSEGLRLRGVNYKIAENINLFDVLVPGWQFETKEVYARMAVAIGSSDMDKPALKYLAKMDPLTYRSTYTPLLKYKK